MTDLAAYHAMIARKAVAFEPAGLKRVPALHSSMFPHQAACTDFALRTGCAGLFLSTGLGKSLCELEWARVIVRVTNKPVLMLAPLAVSYQHEREAAKFGIDAKAIRDPSEIDRPRIYITNYERVDKFDPDLFDGVALDESGILKSFTGATSRKLRQMFSRTRYRLAATATPAPNDHMEIGQQSDFLGVMESPEMLSRWFIVDQAEMGRYRIKSAARTAFWDWVASWSRCIELPSDLGYPDDGYILPPYETIRHTVDAGVESNPGAERDGQLRMFRMPDTSATSLHAEKRITIDARAEKVAEIVAAEPGEPWIIWCDTDYEADALMARIPDAIEVRGSQSADEKEEKLVAFLSGSVPKLITKARIAGFGLNAQHCARQAFVGVSYSWEQYHQAVRRSWRFGQTRPVKIHVVMAETEGAIWNAILRKGSRNDEMKDAMRAAMLRAHKKARVLDSYRPKRNFEMPDWMGAAHG